MKRKLLLVTLCSFAVTGCSGVVQRRIAILKPSCPDANSSKAILGAIDRYLSSNGYRVRPELAPAPALPDRALDRFTSISNYSKFRGGKISTYAGPNGAVAYVSHYAYIPPFQFPSMEFDRIDSDLSRLERLPEFGYERVEFPLALKPN